MGPMAPIPLLLLLVAAAPGAMAKSPPKDAKPPAVEHPEGWADWKTAEGGYSLAFPGEPRLLADTNPGGSAGSRSWVYEQGESGEVAFMTAWTRYPPGALGTLGPAEILDMARDGALKSVNGTLVSETTVDAGGNPGRELVIAAAPARRVYARLYFVGGDRMIQALVVCPEAKLEPKDIRTFLESFRLLVAR